MHIQIYTVSMAHGKNFVGVFFGLFHRADQDSEKILPKHWL